MRLVDTKPIQRVHRCGCLCVWFDTDEVPRFKTVELPSLTNDDIVAIFMQDARLTDLVDTARKVGTYTCQERWLDGWRGCHGHMCGSQEEWNGATFTLVLDTDNMNVQRAINEVLSSRISTGKVSLIVTWLKRIDPNAVSQYTHTHKQPSEALFDCRAQVQVPLST